MTATAVPTAERRGAGGGRPGRHRRRVGPWRWTFRVVAALVGACVVYLAATAAQVWWTSRRNDSPPAQAIVVMGAAQYDGRPSPVLAARLGHALALWRAGLGPRIVVTGGKEPADAHTEAWSSATWLEAHGVPASAIAAQVAGRDSWQSLAGAAAYLVPHGLTDVLLVSDPYHEERIVSMSERLGLDPHPSPTRSSPIRGTAALPFYGRETLAVGIGRLIGYGRLSDLMHGLGGSATLGTAGGRRPVG